MSARAGTPPLGYGLSQGTAALILVALLTLARFAIAPFVPLAFDEAYYWRWSLYPSLGYFDHPPMVAWLIALGTSIAGHNEFGVRLVPLVLSVPASWAVWRAGIILFGDRQLAMTALTFFSVMLIVAVGTILATPDASLLIASAFLLYALAKVTETGRPVWWLATGVVVGLGLLAKFTALFWLPSIFLWLLFSPRMRRWLATPWPWAGAIVSILIFLPNLVWNATHDWATFTKQFGRVVADDLTPQYLIEHFGTEIGMATPIVFVLGWMALWAFMTRRGGPRTTRLMILALVVPITVYFYFHATHSRVEGNWTGPIFPAFALAAAAAIHSVSWRERTARLVGYLRGLAAPVGAIFVAAIYAQTLFGWLPLGGWDPTASRIGAGMAVIAEEAEAIRRSEGASLIITDRYPMTGWLSFYSPAAPAPVFQFNEPERWVQEPAPDPGRLAGPLIALLPATASTSAIEARFGPAERIATLVRRRGNLDIAEYAVYLLPGAETPN